MTKGPGAAYNSTVFQRRNGDIEMEIDRCYLNVATTRHCRVVLSIIPFDNNVSEMKRSSSKKPEDTAVRPPRHSLHQTCCRMKQ